MKQLLLALALTLSCTAWATDCPEDIQVIEKGQVANCDGLLFSPEASAEVDETQQDLKFEQELNAQLMRKNVLLEQYADTVEKRLQLYVDQSNTLAKELTKREDRNKWEKFLYFGLGIVVTGIAVDAASELRH